MQEIRDSWIDNIDWVKVKEKGEDKEDKDEDSSDGEETTLDETAIYKELLQILKPGETVTKALRRLGGKGSTLSASQRLKMKKQKLQQKDLPSEDDKKNMEQLTELADKLISNGNMDTYELTYEKLNFLVNKAADIEDKSRTVIPEGMDDDDALDMFAENFDSKDKGDKSVKFAEDTKPETKDTSEKKPDKGWF